MSKRRRRQSESCAADPRGLRILAEPCDQCPFEGRCELGRGGLAAIVRECKEHETYFTCHKTLESVSGVPDAAAVCRGFHNRYPHNSPSQQIADRLGMFVEVQPPATPAKD